MSVKPYRIRFTYLDGRPAYSYALEAVKIAEAQYRYQTIVNRLKQDNENGVARLDLKVGNKIIVTETRFALPSRWYIAKAAKGSFFDNEGRPWAVCVPNSPRRSRHFATEAEAQKYAQHKNSEAGVDKVPQS